MEHNLAGLALSLSIVFVNQARILELFFHFGNEGALSAHPAPQRAATRRR